MGEAFILARPLGLVLPEDLDRSQFAGSGLPEMLARRLLSEQLQASARHDAALAEELFSLYDGSASYGARWEPTAWSASQGVLPTLGSDIGGRIDRIIKFNAHRCPGGRDPRTGDPVPGLGLWLWPPFVNHALEADPPPNCAHVFFGDTALYRATRPVKAGEELLDRYTSPLALRFEQTLSNLEDHGMTDPKYEACAQAWGSAAEGPPGQRALVACLARVERGLAAGSALSSVREEDYRTLARASRDAAEEARRGLTGLPLAPPEVRALDILCPLAAAFDGRAAALEWRMELARRVQEARPFHFSALGLAAELHARLVALPRASLDKDEAFLASEAERRAREAAAFWLTGRPEDGMSVSEEELSQVFIPWVLETFAFRFGWFSTGLGPRLESLAGGRRLQLA